MLSRDPMLLPPYSRDRAPSGVFPSCRRPPPHSRELCHSGWVISRRHYNDRMLYWSHRKTHLVEVSAWLRWPVIRYLWYRWPWVHFLEYLLQFFCPVKCHLQDLRLCEFIGLTKDLDSLKQVQFWKGNQETQVLFMPSKQKKKCCHIPCYMHICLYGYSGEPYCGGVPITWAAESGQHFTDVSTTDPRVKCPQHRWPLCSCTP